MVTPEFRSNSRHEFSVAELGYERPGGCFVTYRKIAFAFVFFLALCIIAAFVGVYIGTPPDKDIRDALDILSREDEEPELFILASSIKPLHYRIKLQLIPEVKKDHVKVIGSVAIDFAQHGANGPSQLVLNCKHLTMKDHYLIREKNGTADNGTKALRPRRLDDDEMKHEGVPNESAETISGNGTSKMEPLRMAEEPTIKTELKITGNKTDAADGLYVIFLENSLEDGNYTLEIEYEATVDDRVIFMKNFTENDEERLLLVSKLKPANAPRLFPTLDEAKRKATFVLTLLHPRDTKVLSNTPLLNTTDSSMEDLVETTFGETFLMSGYSLAFVSANGLQSSDEVAPGIRHWSSNNHDSNLYLHEKLLPTLEVYKELFGVTRPDDKLDVVALDVDFDGLSAPGLIVMRESLFHVTPDSPPPAKTKALLNLIGLVGAQWLGGLVDAKNWTDAWYIEGSLIYFQYALLHKIDPSLEASDDFLIDIQMETMENDAYKVSKALDSKVNRTRIEAFDLGDNYRKGACLISMLHAVLRPDVFRRGYAGFLHHWNYASADSDTFLRTLVGHTTIDGEIHLHKVITSWTRQSGYPLINVTWDRDNGTVHIRQAKFNLDELPSEDDDEEEEEAAAASPGEAPLWWVPLTYATSPDDWVEPSRVWLKGTEEMSLQNVVAVGDWIVFNVNRTGYYRVNYDVATWRSLGQALREHPEDFSAATRASLIDDALSIARQGDLAYSEALGLLDYLGPNERDLAPWRALANHAAQLDFALYETPAYPSFQEFMRKLLSTLFDEMEPKIDEGSPLAILALQLACLYEYQKCVSWAKNKWEESLRSDGENTLPTHIRETVYCIGAQRGGQEELTYLMREFSETNVRDEKDRLLSALGCFQSPWILQKILNEILEDNKYDDRDVKVILQSYAQNPAAAQAARRFVQENWKEIVKRFSSSYWTMKSFVEASTSLLFTEHDLKEFNAFRDENIDSLMVMGHWVALNEMKAYGWVSRLKQSSGSIQKWFRSRTNTAPAS